ncbi:putative YigZ family protein [Thermocatellispora tengchongensis]|uniref:Putative YigZ family protein n=1 Tax=Thermocatellispora tengchongensis TaxID=1073253 RepID=A0A840PMS4_9ACTN|nr:YigZ family protein [Thermocatellispora tengchongensis]MBB5138980.1 putative YigZ family protein [Thermocatellispora tengchongensis]
MPEPYLTVSAPAEHEIEIKRSRFLCAVAGVSGEDEARAFVEERRRLHPGARHTCSAYVLGGDRRVQRGDDDGEPGGTAGTPMLETVLRRGFSDTVAVVTRYFGGVLLGAGGLARAYGRAVGETLEDAPAIRMVPARVMEVRVGHGQAGRLESDLRASAYPVREVRYGPALVAVEAAVGEGDLDRFRDWIATVTAGRAEVEQGPVVYVPA